MNDETLDDLTRHQIDDSLAVDQCCQMGIASCNRGTACGHGSDVVWGS